MENCTFRNDTQTRGGLSSSVFNDIKRIMVVDDEPEFTKTLMRHLRREGYDTVTASNGDAAIKKIRTNETHGQGFDLVITDIIMPNTDGIELLRWIKAHYPNISVIILSGFGDNDTITPIMRKGMDAFVQKPLTPVKMKMLIEEIDASRKKRPPVQVS